MIRTRPISVALLVCFGTLLPWKIQACDCSGQRSIRDEFAKCQAVFIGKAIRRVPGQGGFGFNFEFEVNKSWKGADQPHIEIHTGQGGGDCGYEFKIGEAYLVYAWELKDGRLYTGICNRTCPEGWGGRDHADLEDLSLAKIPNWIALVAVVLAAFVGGIVVGRGLARQP